MPFQKGHGPNGSGRPKGSKTMKTHGVDNLLRYVAEEGSDEFMEKLKGLDDEKFVAMFRDVLEYVKPKLARKEVVGKDGGAIEVKITDFGSKQ